MKVNDIYKACGMQGRVNKFIEQYSWEIRRKELPWESKLSRAGHHNVCPGLF
jgi:hypothetical protein